MDTVLQALVGDEEDAVSVCTYVGFGLEELMPRRPRFDR